MDPPRDGQGGACGEALHFHAMTVVGRQSCGRCSLWLYYLVGPRTAASLEGCWILCASRTHHCLFLIYCNIKAGRSM
jgi:hypothetical protein